MKRKIIITVLLFFSVLNVKALTVDKELQEDVFYNIVTDSGVYKEQLYVPKKGSSILYSLDPFNTIYSNYEEDESVIDVFEIDKKNLFAKMASVSNRNYINGVTNNYYMVLQKLIWEENEEVNEIYYTDAFDNVIDISHYYNELVDYTSIVDTIPFGDLSFNVDIYDLIKLEDITGVLKYYRIYNDSPNNIYYDDNSLNIKITDLEDFVFYIENRFPNYTSEAGYISEGSNLVSFNYQHSNRITINVDVSEYKTKLKINTMIDNEKVREKIYFKILNLESNSYYSNNGVEIFETDKNGEFLSDFKLSEGRYKIVNIDIPEPYVFIDNQEFMIKKSNVLENERFVVNNYIDDVNCNLKIASYLNDEKVEDVLYYLYAKENVYNTFNDVIYYKNQLINIIEKQDNVNINLPIGKYYLVVKSSNNKLLDEVVYDIDFNYVDKYTRNINLDLNTHFNEDYFNLVLSSYQSKLDNQTNVNSSNIDNYYELYAMDDIYENDVIKYRKDDYIGTYYSDEENNINITKNLLYGNYYIVSSSGIRQNILYDSSEIVKELVSKNNIVMLFKSGDKILANKSFEIEFENNIYNIKTDENGKYVIEDVLAGIYSVKINDQAFEVNTEIENEINLDLFSLPNTYNFLLKYRLILLGIVGICIYLKRKYS